MRQKQLRETCSVRRLLQLALKMQEESHRQGVWVASRSGERPLADSQPRTGNSVLRKHGTEFCQHLNELGNGFIPRASRKKCSPANTSVSAL